MNKSILKMFVFLLHTSLFVGAFGFTYATANSVYKVTPSWIVESENSQKDNSNLVISRENRVMFDEDIWWALDRSNTDVIIDKLSRAGFNVYIPCVWHGAGAYFKSSVAYADPRVRERIRKGDDPLEYLIQKAHEKNIEVHAWVTVVRRDDNRYREFYNSGTPEDAFDVHNLKFREFIISLMVDLVKNYSIDGLNLDYIRSMGYCKSKICIDEYESKYSRSFNADMLLEKVPQSRIKSIELWNEFPIEHIVETVSVDARKINPNLIISVDSKPNARHLRMQGHDSQKWLNNKWIDKIFYMEYKNDFELSNFDLAKSKVNDPDSIIPLISLYDMEYETLEKKPGILIRKSIETFRNKWPKSGVSFYHYKQFTEEQAKELSETVYSQSAIPTWQKCDSKKCF